MKRPFLACALAVIACTVLTAGVGHAQRLKPPKPTPSKPSIPPDPSKPDFNKPDPTKPPFHDFALRDVYVDAEALHRDQARLIQRVADVQKVLQDSSTALGVLDTLDSDLKQLEKALQTLYATADAVAAIPQAHEKASKVKDTLAATQKSVTAARQRTDAIVAKTDPVRKNLDAAAQNAQTLGTTLTGLNVVVAGTGALAWSADTCLNIVSDARKQCATDNTERAAKNVDNVLVAYDNVVKPLIATPGLWLPSMSFLDPINADLPAIFTLRDDVEALYKRVNALAQELTGLVNLLNRNFSFRFPYPNPKKPWTFDHYTVNIGFKTIIQGSDAIEKEIERILSSFLWTMLKKAGVSKYVNELIADANNAVNDVLNAVHFDVGLSLPDVSALNAIEKDLPALLVAIDGVRLPVVGKLLPGYGFPGMSGIDCNLLDGFFPNGLRLDSCPPIEAGCN